MKRSLIINSSAFCEWDLPVNFVGLCIHLAMKNPELVTKR